MKGKPITPSEKRKILKLLDKGLTIKEVAKEVGMSERTVKKVKAEARPSTKPPMAPGKAKEPRGIWLSVMEDGVQKQIQVIRFEDSGSNSPPYKILTPEGAEYVTEQASYGCSQEEIASALGVSIDTLMNGQNGSTFREAYQKGIDNCRRFLRRTQYNAAKDGNTAMMIWLGKNILGQSDKVSVESKSDVTVDVTSRKSVKEAARAILEREGMLDDKQ